MYPSTLQRIWLDPHTYVRLYSQKEKSRTMKFIHLSPPSADFSAELQSQIRILNGNILYITREVDKIIKIVTQIKLDQTNQKTVDDFYEDKSEDIPEDA